MVTPEQHLMLLLPTTASAAEMEPSAQSNCVHSMCGCQKSQVCAWNAAFCVPLHRDLSAACDLQRSASAVLRLLAWAIPHAVAASRHLLLTMMLPCCCCCSIGGICPSVAIPRLHKLYSCVISPIRAPMMLCSATLCIAYPAAPAIWPDQYHISPACSPGPYHTLSGAELAPLTVRRASTFTTRLCSTYALNLSDELRSLSLTPDASSTLIKSSDNYIN